MSAKSTPTSIDASALKTSLGTLAPILEAFNHRHKNAHHSSHWWSHFDILRRSVKKLLDSPSRQDALLPRLRWMRDVIVPRAYVPFTQLVADSQHAPLGLLLMGVLARINTILIDQLGGEATSTPIPTFERRETKTDKGVTISREEFTKPKDAQTPGPRTDVGLVVSGSDHAKSSVLKSQKPTETDEFAQIFASEDHERERAALVKSKGKKAKPAADSETAAPPKKKTKKAKAKGGDAFSSIFDSL